MIEVDKKVDCSFYGNMLCEHPRHYIVLKDPEYNVQDQELLLEMYRLQQIKNAQINMIPFFVLVAGFFFFLGLMWASFL